MIPDRVVHHVCVWSIMRHTAEFTHDGRSLFEVKSHTVLRFWDTDDAASTRGCGVCNLDHTDILADTILFRKATWHRPLWKYGHTSLAKNYYMIYFTHPWFYANSASFGYRELYPYFETTKELKYLHWRIRVWNPMYYIEHFGISTPSS